MREHLAIKTHLSARFVALPERFVLQPILSVAAFAKHGMDFKYLQLKLFYLFE